MNMQEKDAVEDEWKQLQCNEQTPLSHCSCRC